MLMVSGVNKPSFPDFFIVGAAKSGTTSLAYYLNQHPDIFVPEIKEPRYFAKDSIFKANDSDPTKSNVIAESVFDLDEYKGLYSNKGSRLALDASVHYLYHHDEVIPKIKKAIGDPPIIIMLRNPVDRAISNVRYLYEVHFNTVEKEILNSKKYFNANWNSFWYYIELGFYYEQVKAYKSNFSQVHIILFDEFKASPEDTYLELLDFLGVPRILPHQFSIKNASEKPNLIYEIAKRSGITSLIKLLAPQQLTDSLKSKYRKKLMKPHESTDDLGIIQSLYSTYSSDISELERLINRDLSLWKNTLSGQ